VKANVKSIFDMPARGESKPRQRKTSKPFEGAELPRVNKTKQKSIVEASKSATLHKKKNVILGL
jgi:hypothetical protein